MGLKTLLTFPRIAVFAAALSAPAFAQDRLNDFDRVLPTVAAGFHVVAIETTLVLVNPHEEAVEVSIESTNPEFFEDATLLLQPGERRRILLSGEELWTASLRFRAPQTVSVSAFITTRETVGGPILSQVTLAAEPLASSVVIPVFHRTEEIGNTSLAIFWREFGRYQIMLFDNMGERIGWVTRIRNEPTSPNYEALFLDELFDSETSLRGADGRLPEDFAGWLHVFGGQRQARGFSATAMYSGPEAGRYWSVGSTAIDVIGAYELVLEGELEPAEREELMEELADLYGFDRTVYPFVILCTDAVATAVEREPRVRRLRPRWAPLNISD